MNITLKYFASIREALAQSELRYETQASHLGQLREELCQLSAAHAHSLGRGKVLRMALNQVMAEESALLTEGCEVAFFPPVTGG